MNPFHHKCQRLVLPALAASAGLHLLLAFVPESFGGLFFGAHPSAPPPANRMEIVQLAPDPIPQYVEHVPNNPSAGASRVIAPPPPSFRPSALAGDSSLEPLVASTDLSAAPGPDLPLETAPASGDWAGDSTSALSSYLAVVFERIGRAKRYPEAARLLGQTGTVTLAFGIARDGRLEDGVRLAAPCRYSSLNHSALACVESCAPFPPLPGYVLANHLQLTVSLLFSLDQ